MPKKTLEALTVFLAVGFFIGCAKMAHLSELLTLKALSDEQQGQQREIELQDKKFEVLLQEIRNNRMEEYSRRDVFLRKFGQPIVLDREIWDGREEVEKLLYRRSNEVFEGEKVYVYFDTDGRLVKWEHLLANSE